MTSALGRGLQSLIPKKNPDKIKTESGLKDLMKLKKESVFNIEVDKIRPNPNQPRKEMSKSQLNELADSIKEYGILQPIIVTKVEKATDRGRDVEYELVAGERRWRAAQIAKLPRIPVIIKDNSKQVKFEMALVENVQRENLNPIEKAMAYKRLNEEFGLKHEEIARRVGRNRPTISNALRLLRLPPIIQVSISSGKISERQSRAILAIAPEKRMAFYKKMIKEGWNEIKAEDEAKKLARTDTAHRPAGPKNIYFKELEKKINTAMGHRISITERNNIGRLVICFEKKEELDKIADYLMKF